MTLDNEKISIRPSGNKSRFGYRGSKQRYAVFKAMWNQKWAPVEEEEVRKLCKNHGVEPEQFLREDDNPNRKWSYALIRAKRMFLRSDWPNILLHNGKSPFYRY